MNLAEALVNYLKAKGAEKSFHGSIDFNPLRKALRHGAEINAEIVEKAIKLIKTVESVPSLRVLAVDSVFFCDGGAYIFQELGYALAWGAQWMTALTDAAFRPKKSQTVSSSTWVSHPTTSWNLRNSAQPACSGLRS